MKAERKREIRGIGRRRKRRRKGERWGGRKGRRRGGRERGGGRRPVCCVYEIVPLSNISHKEIIIRKRWIDTSDGEQLKLHLCSWEFSMHIKAKILKFDILIPYYMRVIKKQVILNSILNSYRRINWEAFLEYMNKLSRYKKSVLHTVLLYEFLSFEKRTNSFLWTKEDQY